MLPLLESRNEANANSEPAVCIISKNGTTKHTVVSVGYSTNLTFVIFASTVAQ